MPFLSAEELVWLAHHVPLPLSNPIQTLLGLSELLRVTRLSRSKFQTHGPGRFHRPDAPESNTRHSTVIGIDVSPHHYNPEESVENLYLNVDNLNMPLQFHSNHFDLINSRLLAGGIDRNRWHGYMRDILRCLRGNGWCQMVEIDFTAQSDNGTITDGHALRQWSDKYRQAMSQFKNPEAPRRLAHWMRHAGFTDVEERKRVSGRSSMGHGDDDVGREGDGDGVEDGQEGMKTERG
ncbi:hypothetical protein GGR53DRAFT_463469 [Hypoxylon sp. FL1150]|nr:hypothetical protein GGR53DRAFT_463469 [Hypoxylon sp. FL1150]